MLPIFATRTEYFNPLSFWEGRIPASTLTLLSNGCKRRKKWNFTEKIDNFNYKRENLKVRFATPFRRTFVLRSPPPRDSSVSRAEREIGEWVRLHRAVEGSDRGAATTRREVNCSRCGQLHLDNWESNARGNRSPDEHRRSRLASSDRRVGRARWLIFRRLAAKRLPTYANLLLLSLPNGSWGKK